MGCAEALHLDQFFESTAIFVCRSKRAPPAPAISGCRVRAPFSVTQKFKMLGDPRTSKRYEPGDTYPPQNQNANT